MKTFTSLDKAKAQIVMDHPFFATMLLKRSIVIDPAVKTLEVDARGTIYANQQFIDSLSVPQLVWGLCHEIGHVMAQHAVRKGSRNHKKWNYAGDAWINDMLSQCKVGDPIPKTVDMPGSYGKTTEKIYDELPDGDDGDSGGDPGGDQWDNGLGQDVRYTDLTEGEIKEIEAGIKVEIAQAAQAAKAKGKLTGKLAEFVADFLAVKTPWYDIVERHFTDLVSQEMSWLRPNRRFIANKMYLPSMARTPGMGEVVFQVDVSGSVSRTELAYYNGHVARFVEQCNPTKVHVLYVDTEVKRYDVFEQGEEVKLGYFSGGGTHMPAGFDFINEQGIDPDVFLCLTDGYTDFGEPPEFPVIWCISSGVTATHGETVHFEME